MSVAFRREGDEEHVEPKFELPIPPGPNLVTPRGLALIGAKVAALETAMAGMASADKDDPARKSALRDLRYWQTRQVTAQVVPAPTGDVAAIGTNVHFRLNGKDQRLTIVGDDEADPAAGLISFAAPLSRALLGAGPGDWRDFAGREDAIEVLGVAVAG